MNIEIIHDNSLFLNIKLINQMLIYFPSNVVYWASLIQTAPNSLKSVLLKLLVRVRLAVNKTS